VGRVQKDGKGVAVARAGNDHVAREFGPVVEDRAALWRKKKKKTESRRRR
jgi:hypothetical protein